MDSSYVQSMHPLEIKAILAFRDQEILAFEQLEHKTGLDAARIRRAMEWLLTKNALEICAEEIREFAGLTETGQDYARNKLPEIRILIRASSGITMADLQNTGDLAPDEISPAIGALKKAGLIVFGEGGRFQTSTTELPEDLQKMQALIESFLERGESLLRNLDPDTVSMIETMSRKRGKSKGVFRIDERVFRTYRLTEQGRQMIGVIEGCGLTGEETSKVLPEHLKDGKWRNIRYRRFCLDLPPPRILTGKRNPYRIFLDFVKRKLLSLGFEEMNGDHVETEFWNMDALFMPQFHSARDIHDVYFLDHPSHAKSIEEPYLSNVAAAHTDGAGTGSTGWGYHFDRERSRQLLLRSQGTVLSARWLHKARVPGKYFALARCFRYDSVDATHAADFFQIEGIVLAENNTLCTLLGLLKLFAREVAHAEEIKFTPGYFPFTEPSVEAHIRHPAIGWMEMGGAGIFRPEVIGPQGVDVPVIAWGLGLDRMAMVAMGINDIRDLFATDLGKIRSVRLNFGF